MWPDADLCFDWLPWFQEEEIEKMRGLNELNQKLVEENEQYKQVTDFYTYNKCMNLLLEQLNNA